MKRCNYCRRQGRFWKSVRARDQFLKEYPNSPHSRFCRCDPLLPPKKLRKCGYCRITGHDRRTCATLKIDREDVTEKILDWRREFLNIAKESGYGIGTLMKIDETSPASTYRERRTQATIEKHGRYGFVEKIYGHRMDHRQRDSYANLASVRIKMPTGNFLVDRLPEEFNSIIAAEASSYERPLFKIVGPTNADKLKHHFGASWVDGSDVCDEILGLH